MQRAGLSGPREADTWARLDSYRRNAKYEHGWLALSGKNHSSVLRAEQRQRSVPRFSYHLMFFVAPPI